MGDLSLPFRERGRRHPDCPSGDEWADTLKDLRVWLQRLTRAHPQGAYHGGAGQMYMAWPPAEFLGSWLCRLQPDFQERPRWPLRAKMLPPPHLPGRRVLISYQVPRMKPQSAWQPLLCTGGGAEKVWVPFVAQGPLIVRGSLAHKSMERGLNTIPKRLQRSLEIYPGEEGVKGDEVGSQTSE